MSDAEANKVLLRELKNSSSIIIPEALQKQLCSALESCSSQRDIASAKPVVSQLFKFYRDTNMLKLITQLHFSTAAEAFSSEENLLSLASAALSCAKEQLEAAVTTGTVIAYIGICELFSRMQMQRPDLKSICLLQLELFDKLDDFETEDVFESNVVKKSMLGSLQQQNKSHIFASRMSTSCSVDQAYPAIKSPSFRN